METTHPPYSPDHVPAEFFLFTVLKSAPKGKKISKHRGPYDESDRRIKCSSFKCLGWRALSSFRNSKYVVVRGKYFEGK
jgi:hypothetical protein